MIYLVVTSDKNYCKIGYSKDPDSRLATLQTSHPEKLTLAAVIEGTIKEEKELHKQMAEHRVNLEWFNLSQDIMNHFDYYPTLMSRIDAFLNKETSNQKEFFKKYGLSIADIADLFGYSNEISFRNNPTYEKRLKTVSKIIGIVVDTFKKFIDKEYE